MKYELVMTRQAVKDLQKITSSGLLPKVRALMDVVGDNPFQTPPSFKKLVGNMQGVYSRRITLQHRFVYEVDEEHRVVKIIRLWTHYGD